VLTWPQPEEVPPVPTMGNGKICYLELPAVDVDVAAAFYAAVFGWRVRRRGDGATAFDDGVGEVSGTWVVGRPPSTRAGLLVYVMVEDIEATLGAVVAHGGRVVQPVGADAPEVTARISDPAGNVVGVFQEPTLGGAASAAR
jgi:predicted enzyme related to lactoylglutathione lyase